LEAIHGKHVWVMAKGYGAGEGGMQTYGRAVVHAYLAAGARVTVFTRTGAGPRDTMIGPVRLLDVGRARGPWTYLRMARAMRRELKRCGLPALLHGSTWRTSIMPMVLGLDYVTTFHGREFMYPAGLERRLMERVARRASRVVAVSRYSAAALGRRVGALPAPPVVAWNGVTPGLPRPVDNVAEGDVPLIFSMCRLEPRKNLRAAVAAAAACRDDGLRFRFVLAGRGEEYAPLRAQIAQLGLEPMVELAGFIDDQRARQLYCDADIFLHPHVTLDGGRDFEGFGIAIADAMYSRTAVIAGREGGTRELIEDGVSGLLVDGCDQTSVNAALRRLLCDAPLRCSLAQAAARRAEREFSWDRHIRIIVEAAGSSLAGGGTFSG
jgi:phosphatidyl-myo-inositol dimannoside synthase